MFPRLRGAETMFPQQCFRNNVSSFAGSFSVILTDNLFVQSVGILAQNTDGYIKKHFGPTYIVASYIKYIESAGGRVVPIRYPLK